MSLFIYAGLKNLYVLKGIRAAEGRVNQAGRTEEENTTQQGGENHSLLPSWHTMTTPLSVFISSRSSSPLPPPSFLFHIEAPLCCSLAPGSPFVCSAGAPYEGPSAALRAKTEEMALSGGCQEVVSSYWASLTEWPHGGCWSMPGS